MDALQFALNDPKFQEYLKTTIPNPTPGQQPADKVGFGTDFTQTNVPAQSTPLQQQTQQAFGNGINDGRDPPGQVATQEQDATFGNISAALGNVASVATGGVLGPLAAIATNNQSFGQALKDVGNVVKDSVKGFFSGLFGDDPGLVEGNPSKSFDSKAFGIDPGLNDPTSPTQDKDSKSISQSFADDTAGMFDGAVNGITGQKGTPATPSEIAGFKVGALGAFDPDDPSNPGAKSDDNDNEKDGKSTEADTGPSSSSTNGNNGTSGNGNGQDGNGPNGGPSGGSGPGGGAPGGPSGGAPGGVSGSDPY